MMKIWSIFFLCFFFSLHAMGQVPITREKCKTCDKVISQCQYMGKHPKCPTCGKLKERCEYNGEHPKCPDCGKLKEQCAYKGNHPKCPDCGKLKEKCEYKGNHPKCPDCGKLKEKCEYNGEHPKCPDCGKLKEQCEYKGNHPKCPDCGKLKEQCEYKGNHPKCPDCGKLKEQCEYKGNHPKCPDCGKPEEQCEYKGLHLKSFSVGDVTFSMVPVSGGTFTMGATPEQQNPDDDEKPAHEVTLSSFRIGQTEVTQALWKALMEENPSEFKGNNLPVENVSWDDCQTFIRKLNEITKQNFRLPTEAEWEFAARGGNKSRGYQYSGSNTLDEVAWYDDNSSDKTHPVGSKAPNELGLYDMSGNVYEWCQDWIGEYPSIRQANPKGPDSGTYRVRRGGCWIGSARRCRSSNRGDYAPANYSSVLGLRLVLPE